METLTTLREKRGFKNQPELAAKIGVHPTTISQYENGVISPTLERFDVMCEVLDVSPTRLLKAWKETRRLARLERTPVTNLQEVRERAAP